MIEGPTRKMVALYDYDPQQLSPNVDIEVSYKNLNKIVECYFFNEWSIYLNDTEVIMATYLIPSV